MAATSPEKSLQDEATCSVCLDYFQAPMMIIDCGHSFCHTCIAQCCGEAASSSTSVSCPQCRQVFPSQNLVPNRHLWSIVEVAKQFSERKAGQMGEQQPLCPKHKEPLKLFCTVDSLSICLVCYHSRVHQDHVVVPIEEAAQGYQDKIHHCLQTLKEAREKVSSLQSKVEKPIQDLLAEIEAERQKLVIEYQQLRQLFEKEERWLLTELKGLEMEAEKVKKEHETKFSEETAQIGALITELEQKSQEPPSGLLEGIESILNRCTRDQFQPPVQPNSLMLRKELQEFSHKRASLLSELKKKLKEILNKSQWIKEYVTLDPETAHPRLKILENWRSITLGTDSVGLPYSAKRFDTVRCALGSRGFSSGKHYWTIDVSCGSFWAVGVAKESVNRKGSFGLVPEEGIWAVGFYNGGYRALTSPPTFLNLSKRLNNIQICLDYEDRTVAFLEAKEKGVTFFVFEGEFEGENLFPFFRIGHQDTWLALT